MKNGNDKQTGLVVMTGVVRSDVAVWEIETERPGARNRETMRRKRLKYGRDREEEEVKANIVTCWGHVGYIDINNPFLADDMPECFLYILSTTLMKYQHESSRSHHKQDFIFVRMISVMK
ncbi:hypothetical protein E2C01_044112 [Portunus trituberculatus]|uniref:Uncharacterized protein n=1 Tax=Portunus trituberculatus TaxID=210409 RepID=A0A5B7FZI5_PORTR|nr:hypothetical protein [Portunus trituberculatus]